MLQSIPFVTIFSTPHSNISVTYYSVSKISHFRKWFYQSFTIVAKYTVWRINYTVQWPCNFLPLRGKVTIKHKTIHDTQRCSTGNKKSVATLLFCLAYFIHQWRFDNLIWCTKFKMLYTHTHTHTPAYMGLHAHTLFCLQKLLVYFSLIIIPFPVI
jgi:hypothetical protein